MNNLIDKKILSHLPIGFQFFRQQRVQVTPIEYQNDKIIEVKKYQSEKIIAYPHYKPLSKIVKTI